MITKDQLLNDVRMAAIQGLVTLDELTQAFRAAVPSTERAETSVRNRIGITDLLYSLGGAIVFIGIVVLLSQHWKDLSFLTKVLATLGAGFGCYYAGLLLVKEDESSKLAQGFFLISALVMPVGLGIVFDHFGFSTNRVGVQVAISGLLAVFFLASYAMVRTNVFLLFSIIYVSWLFHSLMHLMVGNRPDFLDLKIPEYRVLINGAAYVALGYAFSEDKERQALTGPLYGFGIIFFLGAAFALGGWKPNQNQFWEIVFPGLVFGALFLSVYLKSKSFLTFGALFLMAYIGKITGEYFVDSMGWPLSLVLIGLALMGIGYGAYRLNVQYLRNPA